MGYGIGRIPKDDDGYYEIEAKIDGIERGTYPPRDESKDVKYRRCPECGTMGRAGDYPFSTYGARARGSRQICDDCGA